MANDYLVEIHNYITQKIKESTATKDRARKQGNTREICFHSGQLAELIAIRDFLSTRFDLDTQKYY